MFELLFHHRIPLADRTPRGYLLRWQKTALMAILNVTPDSFSDGGRYRHVAAAISRAELMLAAGALMIDVGGESTRPYAEPVSVEEELERVLPVIEHLAEHTQAIISIDTMKAEVAAAAFKAGAHLLNDVTGLRDSAMLTLCAEWGRPVVIMHMQGEPRSMQQAPHYQDVVKEVKAYLAERAHQALAAGIPSVMIDPGFGFGKSLEHNLELVRHLDDLVMTGFPVLLGASRKGSILKMTGEEDAAKRDPGSIVLHLEGVKGGAAMLRVHDVAAHQQALRVWWQLYG